MGYNPNVYQQESEKQIVVYSDDEFTTTIKTNELKHNKVDES